MCNAISRSRELQRGNPESVGFLESLADFCLTPARSLWLNKEVTYSKGNFSINNDPSNGCCPNGDPCFPRWNYGEVFKETIYGVEMEFEGGIEYTASCCLCAPLVQIPAALVGAIGYPFKKCVLEADEEANTYNQLIWKQEVLKEYEKRKEILTTYLNEMTLKIEGIAYVSASNIERMRETLVNKGDKFCYTQDEILNKKIKDIIGNEKRNSITVERQKDKLSNLTVQHQKYKIDLSDTEKFIEELKTEIADLSKEIQLTETISLLDD